MHETENARNSEPAKYWLTIPEAANRLSVSNDTIRRAIWAGELPAVLFARKYRITVEDLDALVKRAA